MNNENYVHKHIDRGMLIAAVLLLSVILLLVLIIQWPVMVQEIKYHRLKNSFESRMEEVAPNESFGLVEQLYTYNDRYRTAGRKQPRVNSFNCPATENRFDLINVYMSTPRYEKGQFYTLLVAPEIRSNDGTRLYLYRPGTYIEMLADGIWIPAKPYSADASVVQGFDKLDFSPVSERVDSQNIYDTGSTVVLHDLEPTYRITMYYSDSSDFEGEIFALRFELKAKFYV